MTQFKVDFNDFKRRDNTNLMEITLYNDSGEQITPNRDHQWSGKALKFGDGDKRLDQELAVTLDGDKIGVPSKQLENLPSGDYGLELWEVNNDSKTIYPSAGFVEFHIHRNADESLESVTPTTDINKVIDDLHQAGLNMVVDGIEMLAPDATPSVTSEVRDGKSHIKLHVPIGSVDNTALTNAPAFKALQTQVNNSAVGTNLVKDSEAEVSGKAYEFHDYHLASLTELTPGKTYTMSFSAKVDDKAVNCQQNIFLDIYNSSWVFYTTVSVPISTDYRRVTQTFTIPEGQTGVNGISVFLSHPLINGNRDSSADQSDVAGTGCIKEFKLEEGSVATDWCPNPTEILTQTDYAKIKAAIVALGGSLS